MASNASASALESPVTIYCKDETGSIIPWPNSQGVTFASWRYVHYNDGESPLSRIAELFNVNHFIVSQAWPNLLPLLRSELSLLERRQAGQWNLTRPLMRLVMVEIRHRLKQLDYIGLLPQTLCRILIDEAIPGSNLALIPSLALKDFIRIFRSPTKDGLANWILKGERGVWPAVSALKVRCAIEIELDKGYQLVRRRRSTDHAPIANVFEQRRAPNEGIPRRRRAWSTDHAKDATGLLQETTEFP